MKLNLGDTEYTHLGRLFGPGVVEIPDDAVEDIKSAIGRRAASNNTQVDPTVLTDVKMEEIDDDVLLAELKRRKAIKDATKNALDTSGDKGKTVVETGTDQQATTVAT